MMTLSEPSDANLVNEILSISKDDKTGDDSFSEHKLATREQEQQRQFITETRNVVAAIAGEEQNMPPSGKAKTTKTVSKLKRPQKRKAQGSDDSNSETGDSSNEVVNAPSVPTPSLPFKPFEVDEEMARNDDVLSSLLEEETQLRLKIETLEEEILVIEKRLNKGKGPASSRRDGTPDLDGDNSNAEEDPTVEGEEDPAYDWSQFQAPEWCVPIRANVMTFDWDKLAEACQFDVILMDPPWQLTSAQPTRGVAIGYQQLPDACIEEMPIQKLSTNGFIFIWVINNKYTKAFDLMDRWGYTFVDDVTWVKKTVNRRMAKGHGYYLQHAKETCLVGRKGEDPPGTRHNILSDVIYATRRGQSQKPDELYAMIEELVPNGKYIEIFGRKNNLRDGWITLGNEL